MLIKESEFCLKAMLATWGFCGGRSFSCPLQVVACLSYFFVLDVFLGEWFSGK